MQNKNTRTILITGGAGFIGSHVVDYYLTNTDYNLVLLDRLDTSGNQNRLASLPSWTPGNIQRVKFVWHDLKAEINDLVSAQIGKVDDIIHLAAASHVDRSIADPMAFVMDNVVGTTNLLIWAKNRGMKIDGHTLKHTGKFINFSTDEVFGPAAPGHNHKEDEAHYPSNPYSGSKSGQGAMGYSFYVTYGLPVITTYTMNNYGQYQHPEKLIPKAISTIIKGEEMPIFAELKDGILQAVGSRFWLHARDTSNAIEFILRNGTPGQSYNVVGDVEKSNLEVCQEIEKAIQDYCDYTDIKHDYKLKPNYVDFHSTRPGHDRRYALDGSKLAALGWKQTISFGDGIRETVEWYLKNTDKFST